MASEEKTTKFYMQESFRLQEELSEAISNAKRWQYEYDKRAKAIIEYEDRALKAERRLDEIEVVLADLREVMDSHDGE